MSLQQQYEKRLRRLYGMSPELRAKNEKQLAATIWWVKCRNCGKQNTERKAQIDSIEVCTHCGVPFRGPASSTVTQAP